jgi:hypothetical protein
MKKTGKLLILVLIFAFCLLPFDFLLLTPDP